jgi:hypothetical protein
MMILSHVLSFGDGGITVHNGGGDNGIGGDAHLIE